MTEHWVPASEIRRRAERCAEHGSLVRIYPGEALEIADLLDAHDALTARVAELEAALKEATERIGGFQRAQNAIWAERDTLRTQLADANAEISVLKSEAAAGGEGLGEALDRINALRTQNAALVEALEEIKGMNNTVLMRTAARAALALVPKP